MQAADAADGRSTNTSSSTRKEPGEPATPGAGEPRESSKMKKVTTSTTTVLVCAVLTARAEVDAVVARAADVTEAGTETDVDPAEATLAEVTALAFADVATLAADVATEVPDATELADFEAETEA